MDSATLDLLNTLDVETATARWQAADVLFLEQATTYLALNLLPEAALALDRAVRLFSESGQQYELGQAYYFAGILALRRSDPAAAAVALAQAATLFTSLANTSWQHRVVLAQAGLNMQRGEYDAALQLLEPLLEELASGDPAILETWDLPARIELKLLAVHVQLQRGDPAQAKVLAESALLELGAEAPEDPAVAALPHFGLKLVHALGLIARREGDPGRARALFDTAIALMENQRASLPLEEFRTAYLADKTELYADLVLSLLDEPAPDANAVAEAFAVVERARSRALLERLLAAVDEGATDAETANSAAEQAAVVRRELNWLYNRLLGATDGSRHTWPQLNGEIQALEATLQRLEWQTPEWMVQAEPATLLELQASLRPEQVALVYACAGNEVLAFAVDEQAVHVVRHVCSTADLSAALAELRFQLGRVEIGDQYLARHQDRLLTGAKRALSRLYALVLAPLRARLGSKQLLIIPHGELHVLPFHALWDGNEYLLEQFTVTYASSASLVVHQRKTALARAPESLSALAIRDEAIPQAEAEAHAAGRHFAESHLYLEEDAGFEGLLKAAAEADVLHIATHGLFRPDNPFFSALKLADGWIDVRQIYRLPLRAQLVVLSACESGAVQVQGGDEAIGLARGFLGAGASNIVASLWNVHDLSAVELMDRFYADSQPPAPNTRTRWLPHYVRHNVKQWPAEPIHTTGRRMWLLEADMVDNSLHPPANWTAILNVVLIYVCDD
ncbi:MAG: CHAT domain-containing protein [Anaerolineales bacterium]|nr:CHAT domain-containing protein [Anaerolineales bacterium]